LKTFSVAESLSKAGGTMTGDTLHGDNVKAKFGTGNDLEIYHDGNKSYISDVGTGNLILTASNLTVKDAGGTNKYLTTDASTTATTIYHNNVARLATTATGVGVTGGLNTTGNVGIGVTPLTTSATHMLQLGSTSNLSWYNQNDDELDISVNAINNSGNKYIEAKAASQYIQYAGAHIFRVAPSGSAGAAITWKDCVKVDPAGKLLCRGNGTHSYIDPEESLSVSTSRVGTHDYGIFVSGNNGGGGTQFQMRFYNNVHGVKGSITTTSGGTAYNTSSDYRLKTDIQDVSTPVDKVKLLKPCNFAWVAEPSVRIDGFIAHEVAEVVPEAVTGTKDEMVDEQYEVTPAVVNDHGIETTARVMGTRNVPLMQGVDQAKLVPLLTATIQELITRIEALENV